MPPIKKKCQTRRKLPPKQKSFVNEYLVDFNITQAATRAGYSKKTAYSIGSRLLKDVEIQRAIEKKQEQLQKKIEVTPEKVIEELAHMAFDDIKNYLAFRTEKTKVAEGDSGEPIIGYDTIVELKDSDKIDTRNISEVTKGRDGQFKFKLYSKENALMQLAKHLGLFDEKRADRQETEDLKPLAELLENKDDKPDD